MLHLRSLLALCAVTSPALAQGADPAPAKPATVRIPKDLPLPAAGPMPSATRAALGLGQRVRADQKNAAIIPVLVIVSDGPSFLKAVSSWTPTQRFPVLIDDGSISAADNIARFARAFQPKDIVRFQASPSSSGWSQTRADIDAALKKVWSAESTDIEALKKAWEAQSHEPPGIVVANEKDAAWTAAITLAAARGQPIIWIGEDLAPLDLHKWWSADEAAKLDKFLQDYCARSGLSWSDLGDTIDAITLCGSFPNAIQFSPKDIRALTDRIGRHRSDGPNRWAWTGQIFGNPQEAAYRAMCALFLETDVAWLFDSYPKSAPWSDYSLSQSKVGLSAAFKADLVESPGAGASTWREKTQRPLDCGLIFVNTKGNADFFELESGYGYCGDLPILKRPAALHFIHSWSLQSPGSRDTLGGRWLERGVYLYYGSMNEPTLAAFTPCPQVADLLAKGAVFGGAARRDQGPAWKLTLIGDPLATVRVGGLGKLSDAPLPLEGSKKISADAAELARKGDFAGAIRAFILAGDEDMAVKLASAILRDRPAAITPPTVKAAVPALARAGRSTEVVGMLKAAPLKQDDKSTDAAMLRDYLWFACAIPLKSKISPPDASTLEMLKENLRNEQLDQDLIELGNAWAQTFDFAAATGMVESVAARQTEPHLKKKAARALEELRKGRR